MNGKIVEQEKEIKNLKAQMDKEQKDEIEKDQEFN